jgi:hypothetical protein
MILWWMRRAWYIACMCIYIPPEEGGLVIPPGAASYNSQGFGGRIQTHLNNGMMCQVRVKIML